MTSKPVEVRVPITELYYVGWAKITLVEQKSKQMAIDDRPEPMSSPSLFHPQLFQPITTSYVISAILWLVKKVVVGQIFQFHCRSGRLL